MTLSEVEASFILSTLAKAGDLNSPPSEDIASSTPVKYPLSGVLISNPGVKLLSDDVTSTKSPRVLVTSSIKPSKIPMDSPYGLSVIGAPTIFVVAIDSLVNVSAIVTVLLPNTCSFQFPPTLMFTSPPTSTFQSSITLK